jgi:tRNA(Arg) A34 adenosine deaminase TadA
MINIFHLFHHILLWHLEKQLFLIQVYLKQSALLHLLLFDIFYFLNVSESQRCRRQWQPSTAPIWRFYFFAFTGGACMVSLSIVYNDDKLVDEANMRLAIAAARAAAQAGEVPVGAVVTKDGRVVAVGENRIEREGDPTMHAELVAIRAATQVLGTKWLGGCTLYVTVEPCAMCAGAAVLARLTRVVAGTASDTSGACGSVLDVLQSDRLNHRVEYSVGTLEDECATLLSDFFGSLRRDGRTQRDGRLCEKSQQ